MAGAIFPWREGNHFELLVDGPQFFPRMLVAIARAEEQVELQGGVAAAGELAGELGPVGVTFERLGQADLLRRIYTRIYTEPLHSRNSKPRRQCARAQPFRACDGTRATKGGLSARLPVLMHEQNPDISIRAESGLEVVPFAPPLPRAFRPAINPTRSRRLRRESPKPSAAFRRGVGALRGRNLDELGHLLSR